MENLSRRGFGKKALLLSCVTALGLPGTVAAMSAEKAAYFGKVKNDVFLNRDDIAEAIKSYYQTYNCTFPYPHKFNEVVVKQQMRSLQFHMDNGLNSEYVDHYITTMEPILKRIKQQVDAEGADKGLAGMFENTSCAYQFYERIEVKRNRRVFPCPYKDLLVQCKKYLSTFTLNLEDICEKWCKPTWNGFSEKIGIRILVQTGETCTVKLDRSAKIQKGGSE